MTTKELNVKLHCDEGGPKKAHCDGKCIEWQQVCDHLTVEAVEP